MSTIQTPDKPQDNTLKQVQAALQRAALQARKIAAQTETSVVIIRDGKISNEHPSLPIK